MLDHVTVRVADFGRAMDFYRSAMAAIGYEVVMEFPETAGLGEKGKPDVWIMSTQQPVNPGHIALRCSRAQVDAFHAAALAAGGRDNGAPGVRVDYHPNYYATYVLDPDGNNIEVVCHEDPAAPKPAVKAAAPTKAKAKAKAKAKPKAKAKASAKPAAKASARKPAAKAKPKAKAAAKKRR